MQLLGNINILRTMFVTLIAADAMTCLSEFRYASIIAYLFCDKYTRFKRITTYIVTDCYTKITETGEFRNKSYS